MTMKDEEVFSSVSALFYVFFVAVDLYTISLVF